MENLVIDEIKAILFKSVVTKEYIENGLELHVNTPGFGFKISRTYRLEETPVYNLTYGDFKKVSLSQYVLHKIFCDVENYYIMHFAKNKKNSNLFEFYNELLNARIRQTNNNCK